VSLTRRELLGNLARGSVVAAAGAAMGGAVKASSAAPQARPDAVAMLYDTTVCIGCKACVGACTIANGLVPDTSLSGGLWQMPLDLNPHTKNIIQLYQSADGEQESFIKRQCMHCIDPACVAGCPFGALYKGEKGIVSWEGSRCIGCRYCEISCPFDVPRFE
jgi:Fe-S-cluster-containing dehydrogenase component